MFNLKNCFGHIDEYTVFDARTTPNIVKIKKYITSHPRLLKEVIYNDHLTDGIINEFIDFAEGVYNKFVKRHELSDSDINTHQFTSIISDMVYVIEILRILIKSKCISIESLIRISGFSKYDNTIGTLCKEARINKINLLT